MATQILSIGSGAASSEELEIDGTQPVTVVMNAAGGEVPFNGRVAIEVKDPSGSFWEVGRLTYVEGFAVIGGPGTYRVRRISGAVGVFTA